MKYIIMIGDPIQGIAYVGPFNSRDEAHQAALKSVNHRWQIEELIAYDPDNMPLLGDDLKGFKWVEPTKKKT